MEFTTDDIDGQMPRFIWIDKDRYGGVYSGSAFTAWVYGIPIRMSDNTPPGLNWSFGVPDDASGGQSVCEAFWTHRELPTFPIYGGGSTPLEAAKDLLSKISKIETLGQYFLFTGVMISVDVGGSAKLQIAIIENDYDPDKCLVDAFQRLLPNSK